MMEEITSLLLDAIKAVLAGGRRIRLVFFSGFTLILIAIGLAAFAEFYGLQKSWQPPLAAGLAIVGTLCILGIGAYRRALASTAREKVIEAVEERARKHPNEPQAAW